MGQKVNPHGLKSESSRIGIQDGMQRKILQIILLKTIKSENTLKRDYTALVFPEQRSKELPIA